MQFENHGLTIGVKRINSEVFLSLKVQGKLTHEDYLTISPMMEGALEQLKHPKISAYIDASELEGWELRAAWDDLKLGLKYGGEFEKIAIYGNKKWMDVAAKIGSWFTKGEVKHFYLQEDALKWLTDK